MFKILSAIALLLTAQAHAFEVDSCSIDNSLTLLYATPSRVPVIDPSGNVISSSTTTTQLGFLDATSSIQTQLNNKQSLLTFIDSLTNSGGNVSLVNDSATPGNSKYYGTNGSGTLGYFALPTSAVWGSITGTLSDQTDLQNALNAKQNLVSIGTIDSQTKSANGLVFNSNQIIAQSADASFPGLMTTGTQTLAGAKTWSGDQQFNANMAISSNASGISGSNANLPAHTHAFIHLTNAALVSLASADITGVGDGHLLWFQNETGNPITIVNNYVSAPLNSAILTGFGANVTIPAQGMFFLIYNTTVHAWQMGPNIVVNFATANMVTGQIVQSQIANNAVGNAQFRQGAARSLVGVAGNATANVADIVAASDAQVMRRSGTSIGFGAIDVTNSAAVSNVASSSTGASTVALRDINGVVELKVKNPVNAQTGTSYTLAATDNGSTVKITNAAGITLTVPSGLGAEFNCLVMQGGGGQITFAAGGGVTLVNAHSFTKTFAQWSVATITCDAADHCVTGGDMQ